MYDEGCLWIWWDMSAILLCANSQTKSLNVLFFSSFHFHKCVELQACAWKISVYKIANITNWQKHPLEFWWCRLTNFSKVLCAISLLSINLRQSIFQFTFRVYLSFWCVVNTKMQFTFVRKSVLNENFKFAIYFTLKFIWNGIFKVLNIWNAIYFTSILEFIFMKSIKHLNFKFLYWNSII